MTFFHHVYFYPRENAQPDDADRIEALCRKYLAGIPGVLKMSLGRPAGTDRPVVDNDYILALLLDFESADAERAYQVHPDHTAFGQESRPYWSHVRVYDTLGQ